MAGTPRCQGLHDHHLILYLAGQTGCRWLQHTTRFSIVEITHYKERPKDFNPLALEKYEGKGDPKAHRFHYNQMMSMERVLETLNCKLFTTPLLRKALSWFYQLPEGSITNFMSFGRKFLEQYHNHRPQQRSMVDLYMDQRYDKTMRDYLTRFMDVRSQIFNLYSKQVANLFFRGLVKGLHMHGRFLESPPYDLGELRARDEVILRVEESRQKIAKNAAIVISQNKSRAKGLRDYGRRVGDDNRAGRPPRDTVGDKRRSSDYSGDTVKRFKANEEEFGCIFTMPQEKIFTELKDENILRQTKPTILPYHMKDKSKFCMFHNDYEHTLATCKNLYT